MIGAIRKRILSNYNKYIISRNNNDHYGGHLGIFDRGFAALSKEEEAGRASIG